jgi:hypothetical protein
MMKARLVFLGENAADIAKSLEPDNLPNMSMKADGEGMILEFSVEKIGTLLSTADDLLMNIKVAEETLVSVEER